MLNCTISWLLLLLPLTHKVSGHDFLRDILIWVAWDIVILTPEWDLDVLRPLPQLLSFCYKENHKVSVYLTSTIQKGIVCPPSAILSLNISQYLYSIHFYTWPWEQSQLLSDLLCKYASLYNLSLLYFFF